MSEFAIPQNEGKTPSRRPETAPSEESASAQFMQDNRPEAVAQRKLQSSLNQRSTTQLKSLQRATGPQLGFTEARQALISHTEGRGADVSQFAATICATAPEARARLANDGQMCSLLESELDGEVLNEVMQLLAPGSDPAVPPENPEVTQTMQRLEAGVPSTIAPLPDLNEIISPI